MRGGHGHGRGRPLPTAAHAYHRLIHPRHRRALSPLTSLEDRGTGQAVQADRRFAFVVACGAGLAGRRNTVNTCMAPWRRVAGPPSPDLRLTRTGACLPVRAAPRHGPAERRRPCGTGRHHWDITLSGSCL
jgi:hypothetical protein